MKHKELASQGSMMYKESFAVLQKQYRKNMETIKCVREE